MNKQQLIAALRRVAAGDLSDIEPHMRDQGLCRCLLAGNWSGGPFYARQVFQQWPKYSGDPTYPVPCPYGQRNPIDAYSHGVRTDSMYTGPYGELRKELAAFIADYLEEEH